MSQSEGVDDCETADNPMVSMFRSEIDGFIDGFHHDPDYPDNGRTLHFDLRADNSELRWGDYQTHSSVVMFRDGRVVDATIRLGAWVTETPNELLAEIDRVIELSDPPRGVEIVTDTGDRDGAIEPHIRLIDVDVDPFKFSVFLAGVCGRLGAIRD